jgi:hypothetical protein
MADLLSMQYRDLDRVTMSVVADQLTEQAENVPMCKGKSEPAWIACGTNNSAGNYVVCPNCAKHGTLLAIACDLRLAVDRATPSHRR